jgi:hypothetical protein
MKPEMTPEEWIAATVRDLTDELHGNVARIGDRLAAYQVTAVPVALLLQMLESRAADA